MAYVGPYANGRICLAHEFFSRRNVEERVASASCSCTGNPYIAEAIDKDCFEDDLYHHTVSALADAVDRADCNIHHLICIARVWSHVCFL